VTTELLGSARGRVRYRATAAAAPSVAGSSAQRTIRVGAAQAPSRPGGVTG
jgi:hypothetical protein